ncbi:unnamed protein product [Linum tenue]|uniref:Uncharacterized protein n=1 Tax=Linum tenue TaxID=586396 RepID=A0AAV0NU38_9ROSI|nr:unnamed protein product [Linum tenue]
MGNCMVVEEKVVKVMGPDGKILEYTSPTTVQQVLSDSPGQLVCDYPSLLQQQQKFLPEVKLVGGRLYYLVPLLPSTPTSKQKVRFAVPETKNDKVAVKSGGVVRIKLVITMQKLEELLKKD